MILHIIIDQKFIDTAYNIFERLYPGKNEYILPTLDKEIKYIRKTKFKKLSYFELIKKDFYKNLNKYDFVVIHCLTNICKYIIARAPSNIKFVWIGWGSDYYQFINKDLLLKDTKKLKRKHDIENFINDLKKINFKKFIKAILVNIIFKDINKLINKIDYFAPVLYEDYVLFKNSIKFKTSIKYIEWNYGTLEENFVQDFNLKVKANNILVGNSASYENNHLETFNLLKKFNLFNRKIIAPLSYGNKKYCQEIINYGKNIFKDNFYPLVDFFDLKDYINIISSCNIVIMNHKRQQALGNIITMLYAGAKVFLDKENTIYSFFKRNGVYIFTIDDINQQNLDSKLDEDKIIKNREILINLWGEKTILEKTKNLFETLLKYTKN